MLGGASGAGAPLGQVPPSPKGAPAPKEHLPQRLPQASAELTSLPSPAHRPTPHPMLQRGEERGGDERKFFGGLVVSLVHLPPPAQKKRRAAQEGVHPPARLA